MPTNMMIFGDKSDFAIEAMIEPHLVPPTTPWGRMRLWCQSVPMGNIEDEQCGLDQAFDCLSTIAKNTDSYWLEEFEAMKPIEIIDLLDGAIFGWHGDVELVDDKSLEQVRAEVDKYGKFSFLTNWGEQFDGCDKSFILCPPTGAVHIISRHFDSDSNFTLFTTRHSFCSAVQLASDWFYQQRQALSEARHA